MIGCLMTGCGKDKSGELVENTESTETTKELNSALTTDEISMDDLVAAVKLCDYSNIEISTTKQEVTDEAVQKEMENYISYFDAYEHITEGTVEDGQKVDITYKGTIDGEEFDGGSGTYDLEIGSNTFIDGFESGLIGKSVGDTVTLNLKFPDDYDNKDVAGKDVQFEVTINYILGNKIEAELTDDFLSANADYKSVEELKNAVTEYLTSSYESEYETARENEVLDYLIKNCEIPKIPVTYIDKYKASMKSYYETYCDTYDMKFSDFLSNTMGVTEDEFDEQSEQAAINYMQSTIILEAIAKKENITLSDDEFNTYVENFATKNGYDSADSLLQTLEENDETQEMKDEALYNKVMDKLFENVTTKSSDSTESTESVETTESK